MEYKTFDEMVKDRQPVAIFGVPGLDRFRETGQIPPGDLWEEVVDIYGWRATNTSEKQEGIRFSNPGSHGSIYYFYGNAEGRILGSSREEYIERQKELIVEGDQKGRLYGFWLADDSTAVPIRSHMIVEKEEGTKEMNLRQF